MLQETPSFKAIQFLDPIYRKTTQGFLQRRPNRLADESRILVLILKFQLELVMKIQHLLERRKVAGVNAVEVNGVDG